MNEELLKKLEETVAKRAVCHFIETLIEKGVFKAGAEDEGVRMRLRAEHEYDQIKAELMKKQEVFIVFYLDGSVECVTSVPRDRAEGPYVIDD